MIPAFFIPLEGHLFIETSKKLLNKVFDIVNEKDQDVIEITNSLDINSKVELVETIIRDINEEIKIHHLEPNKSLETVLLQTSIILDTIHNNIIDLKKGIEYHKSLWFNSFRSTDYSIIINKLKENKIVLDTRMNDLIKIIQLFKTIKSI
jgi:hypothetical protein